MEEKDEDSHEDSDREYEVDKIVNSRMIGGTRQYFIKWVGYTHKANTWVPVAFISADEAIADYWKNRDGYLIPPEDRTGDEVPIPLSKSPKKRPRRRSTRIKAPPDDEVIIVKSEESETSGPKKRTKVIELVDSDDEAPLARSVDIKNPKWLKDSVTAVPDVKPDVKLDVKVEDKKGTKTLPKFKKSKKSDAEPKSQAPAPVSTKKTVQPDTSHVVELHSESPALEPTVVETHAVEPPVDASMVALAISDNENEDNLWGSDSGSEAHDALFDHRPNTHGYMEQQFVPDNKGFIFRATRANHLSDFLVSSRFRLPNVDLAISICRVWDVTSLFPKEEGKDAFKQNVKYGKVLIYVPSAVQRGHIRPDIDAQNDATALFYLLTEYKAAITEDVQDRDIHWVFIHASERSNLHTLRDLDHLRKRVGKKPPSFFIFGRTSKKDKAIKGKAEDLIKRTWDDGIVITLTGKAILNSPKIALNLFRSASAASPFISMFLHCGLVAKGGLLSWSDHQFSEEISDQEHWQTIGAVVSTLIETNGATMLSPNITKASKALESFPADKDIVYLQELDHYDYWAAEYLKNDKEIDALVNMMKDLRVKHTNKRRWIVLIDSSEKALARKQGELHGIEIIDIVNFNRHYI